VHTQVDDILGRQAQAVMVVESPHRKEVETGIALSGESGKVVSRKLIDRNTDTAIGPLCKKGSVHLSVVNTFSQPLQFDVTGKHRPTLLLDLDSLRTKKFESEIGRKKAIHQLLDEAKTPDRELVDNYKHRLMKALAEAERKRIVVCGVIAQAVFEWTFKIAGPLFAKSFKCQIGSDSVEVFYIWHPSRKSGDKGSAWEELDNSKVVSDLKEFIGPITL
jgi:uracil-DNA glycosylase